MTLPFLLEIGTEEIPDWMIPPAINQLRGLFQDLLDRTKLAGTIASADATPRRLVLRAEGLIDRQPDSEELVMGPPKSAGQGAATGFAKKMGVTPDQLTIETNPKGEYFSFKKHLKGQPTLAILASELPQLILKISFPKTMYWNGKGTERFIRPIRWIVALLGAEIVPFEIAGLRSGNITQGHRVLGKSDLHLSHATSRDLSGTAFAEILVKNPTEHSSAAFRSATHRGVGAVNDQSWSSENDRSKSELEKHCSIHHGGVVPGFERFHDMHSWHRIFIGSYLCG